jgi:hypothetical protein
VNIFKELIKDISKKNDEFLKKSVEQISNDIREKAVAYLFSKLNRLPTYEEYCEFIDKGKFVTKSEEGKTTISYEWDLTND